MEPEGSDPDSPLTPAEKQFLIDSGLPANSFDPTRTVIEGYNGYVKTAKKEAVANAAHRRVRGFAASALIAVLCLVAGNIRKMESSYKGGEAPVGEPKPKPTKYGYTRVPAWVKNRKREADHRPGLDPGADPGLPAQPVPDAA